MLKIETEEWVTHPPTPEIDRERSLEALSAALYSIGTGVRPLSTVADHTVTKLVAEVVRTADPSLEEDGQARFLLGRYSYFRYLALPPGVGQEDLDYALALWGAFVFDRPDLLPPEALRLYVERRGAECFEEAEELRVIAERTGELQPLQESVTIFRTIATHTPPEHPMLWVRLRNLGVVLWTLFERTGERDVLKETITTQRHVAETIPPDEPHLGGALGDFCAGLQVWFDETGDLGSLEEAITVGRRAISILPAGHPDLGKDLSNLATAQRKQYLRTGEEPVLAEAFTNIRKAVDVSRQDDNHGVFLANLGNLLLIRFGRTGELDILTEAVGTHRRAVAATPDGHSESGEVLCDLGNALRQWFERTGEPDGLDEAVRTYRRAVRAVPDGHPGRRRYLYSLGGALLRSFEHTGDRNALNEAISVGREAVASTPDNHPDLGVYLTGLCVTLQRRFVLTDNLADITDAVEFGRRSVDLCPADHPDRSGRLFDLGAALGMMSMVTGADTLLEEGRNHLHDAWAVDSAPLDLRVAAATGAANFDLIADDADHALAMAERAVALLKFLAPRSLRRSDRLHRATRTAGLASIAATAAIAAGKPGRAVELLEQTRGLLITDTLDTRGDTTTLRRHAPQLADEFASLREAIDELDHTTPDEYGLLQPEHRDRPELLAAWDRLLARIRAVPDLTGFLRPLPIGELRRAASSGPVVYTITHPTSSYALILTDDVDNPVQSLPLDGLTEAATLDNIDRLRLACQTCLSHTSVRTRLAGRAEIDRVLTWIWDAITGPVLTHLGYTSTPAEHAPWPRVWWCPVGATAYLPLHAAGHHTSRGKTALDRVISSYTPSVRALLRTTPALPATPTTLVVSVPDAHGTPLDGVEQEVAHLRRRIPTAEVVPAPGQKTTRDSVLTALRDHAIAHFACHGQAVLTDPVRSRLILHDHATAPLTLDHITTLNLAGAHLAYLSACSTTDTNPDHTDEATHLTAAFQLAGYTAVIGTLWRIDDTAARKISQAFYDQITDDGENPPDPRRAAAALHAAISRYRDDNPLFPDHWAALVHTGW